MPYNYNQPYDYIDPKTQMIGSGIGALMGGVLGAATGNRYSYSPAVRGIAGGLLSGGGAMKYGMDYNNMVNQWNDRLQDQARQQALLDLQLKKYEEEQKQYEEIDKPFKMALIEYYKQKSNPEQMVYEKEKRRLNLGIKKNELALSRQKLKGVDRNLPGLGEINYFEAYSGFKPEQRGTPEYRKEMDKFIASRAYAPVKYSDETGQLYRVPTRGDVTPLAIPGAKNVQPPIKPTIGEKTNEGIAGLKAFDDYIDNIERLYDDKYIGMIDSARGAMGRYIPQLSSQKEQAFRAAVSNLVKGYFLTAGTQFTGSERQMLDPWMAKINTSETAFKENLANLKNAYNTIMENRLNNLQASGYRNVDALREAQNIPVGTHTMPDGSEMKNSEMQNNDPFAKYWK